MKQKRFIYGIRTCWCKPIVGIGAAATVQFLSIRVLKQLSGLLCGGVCSMQYAWTLNILHAFDLMPSLTGISLRIPCSPSPDSVLERLAANSQGLGAISILYHASILPSLYNRNSFYRAECKSQSACKNRSISIFLNENNSRRSIWKKECDTEREQLEQATGRPALAIAAHRFSFSSLLVLPYLLSLR